MAWWAIVDGLMCLTGEDWALWENVLLVLEDVCVDD